MEKLEYIIEDRTIAEVLGIQNFTNEESAVLELVKNSFDAQAKNVHIIISKEQMIIEDDGIGMTRNKILDFWMHVGKSDKDYQIGEKENARVLAGSKGVGRFALARLGGTAAVYSKAEREMGIVWNTDWNTNTLDTINDLKAQGTRIEIGQLRDSWTKTRVSNLVDFLSRTYNDDSMKIYVEYQGDKKQIQRYFDDFKLGIHGVSLINLNYDAKTRDLTCRIESDEFKEEALKWCPETNLQRTEVVLNIVDELDGMQEALTQDEMSEEAWGELLTSVGSFSAEFYFSLKNPSVVDADKFCYKHRILEKRYGYGIVLYRNSFSISSYEGKRDWLGFGKRSRLSPAAASHGTGSWRVRENQISGKVIIDKKENELLVDLANRQGLVENVIYRVFIQILLSGIQCFERYRQGIIRNINKKNEAEKPAESKIFEMIVKRPEKLSALSDEERNTFVQELKGMKAKDSENRRQMEETEKKYKYDIRLLNTFATSGLKAASIAHEMFNNRNNIDENVNYIIEALKRYELWDIVNEPDNLRYMHRNIPALLNKNQKINKKIISFMDAMLSESEKQQFQPESLKIHEIFEEIKIGWEKDYSWVDIRFSAEEGMEHRSAKDIFKVIFDNLILNSIQQNDDENILQISIQVEKRGRNIEIVYSDDGKGLPPKFLPDPMRILEVHATSRKNGHGIGMWIVNNTVVESGGEIISIEGVNGFKIKFSIGDRV